MKYFPDISVHKDLMDFIYQNLSEEERKYMQRDTIRLCLHYQKLCPHNAVYLCILMQLTILPSFNQENAGLLSILCTFSNLYVRLLSESALS